MPDWVQTQTTSRRTLDLWRMDDHSYAPRETTVSHMFGLCEALAWWGAEADIPRALGFHCSPLGPALEREPDLWPDAEYAERLGDGSLSIDEAARALRLLNRYLAVCGLEDE